MDWSHGADRSRSIPGILFAEDFDDISHSVPSEQMLQDSVGAERIVETPVFTITDLERARAEGYEVALHEIRETLELEIRANEVRFHNAAIEALQAAKEDHRSHLETTATSIGTLIMATLSSLLPDICRRNEVAGIIGLLHEIVAEMWPERDLCIAVSPEFADLLRKAVADRSSDVLSHLQIKPQAALKPSEARITWETGTASYSSRQALNAVGAILSQWGFLDQCASSEPPPPANTVPAMTTSRNANSAEILDA